MPVRGWELGFRLQGSSNSNQVSQKAKAAGESQEAPSTIASMNQASAEAAQAKAKLKACCVSKCYSWVGIKERKLSYHVEGFCLLMGFRSIAIDSACLTATQIIEDSMPTQP